MIQIRYRKMGGKSPKKVYYYDFQYKGERYFHGPYPTKTEANQAEAQKREELKQPASKIPIDISFLEALNAYLDHCKAQGYTQKWFNHKVYILRAFYSEWYQLPLQEITHEMVLLKLDERASKVSGQTANSDLKILKSFFKFCVTDMKWITTNPCDGIKKYRTEERRPIPYTKEELDRILMSATAEERAYLSCIKHAAARVSEINQLEWDHVHLEEDYRNSYLLKYTRKKKGGLRFSRVDMNEILHRELVFMHSRKKRGDKYVFTNRNEGPQGSPDGRFYDRRRMLRRICKKACVPYRGFHAIRHHAASILAERTTKIKRISLALGHEDPQVTARYLHKLGFGRDETFDLLVDEEDEIRQENVSEGRDE